MKYRLTMGPNKAPTRLVPVVLEAAAEGMPGTLYVTLMPTLACNLACGYCFQKEHPAFTKMKSEGKTSKAPLSEAFLNWKNAKIAILALFGLTLGQVVVWYTGQFYALFFLTQTLKIDGPTANILIAIALVL